MDGVVTAVSRSATHSMSKRNVDAIRLLAGLGVEGDVHMGETVKTVPGFGATRRNRTCARSTSSTPSCTTSSAPAASTSLPAGWART